MSAHGSYSRCVTERTIARNEARDAILEAAVTRLATGGPTAVHPQDICEELGLSKALVNYHFGNRDGLIAESIVLAYERYIDTLITASQEPDLDPVGRLTSWIDALIGWARTNPGLSAALNYPHEAAGVPRPMDAPLAQRLQLAASRAFSNLQGLVQDARASLRDPGDVRELDPTEIALDTAIISWATLGMSVYAAGENLPMRVLPVADYLPMAQERMRGLITLLLSR